MIVRSPRTSNDAEFKEGDHPRAESGEFGSGGGGSTSSSASNGGKPELTPKEKKTLSEYGQGNSYNVNKYLKDPKAGKTEAKKNFGSRASEYTKAIESDAKVVDGAIAKATLSEDTKLFRGVRDFAHIRDAVADLKPGETFSLPTFSSTSRSEKWASGFMEDKDGDNGLIVVNAKAGSNGLDMDSHARHKGDEHEVLLGRNTPFQFDSYDAKTKTVYVTLNKAKGDDKANDAAIRTAAMRIAFDRSMRTIDKDGRLHVEVSNISRACVNPYRGIEIPRSEELGLDPDKIYMLLRDPEELAKAAPTFNGLPLLRIHTPTSADDHPTEEVVGATGTDAEFVAPFLRNSLVVWVAEAIAGIETGAQRELSCSYHYKAVMTRGEYEGVEHDGIMTEIIGNHVTLCEQGRAGSSVLVFDSIENLLPSTAIKEFPMAKKLASRKALLLSGALGVYIRPKLAMDAKIDLSGIVAGVTRKNFAAKRAGIASALASKTKGKLAADADLGDLDAVLDAVADLVDGDEMDDDLDQAMDEDGEPTQKEGESDEDFAKRKAAWSDTKTAKDEEDADAAQKKAEDEADAKEPKVTKAAMDAALARVRTQTAIDVRAAARKDARDLRDAEEAVKPYVGAVTAMDSAPEVLRWAIGQVNPDIELDGVPDSALLPTLRAQPLPGSNRPKRLAQDSAANAEMEFLKMFPTATASVRA